MQWFKQEMKSLRYLRMEEEEACVVIAGMHLFTPVRGLKKKISERAGLPFYKFCNWDRLTLI